MGLVGFSQQVVTTCGNFDQSDSFSLSWTLGEPITETFSTGAFILTQGFQQPGDIMPTQTVNITVGWSGISGYIDPMDKNLDHIFAGHHDHLEILSNFNGIYCPPENINTLVNWEFTSGYQVKASQPFTISLKGSAHDGYSLSLPSQWSVVPVLSSCNQPVSEVFDAGSQVRIVKEVAGTGIYWPEYTINTIGELQTGKSYFAMLDEAATVIYPECTKAALVSQQTPASPNSTIWNDPVKTVPSHLVLIPGHLIVEAEWQTGDVIGGFTPEGYCAGMVIIEDSDSNLGLTLFGDDPLTHIKEGFADGDLISIRHFSKLTGCEQELLLNFDPSFPDGGVFNVNGISALKAVQSSAVDGALLTMPEFNIFPNPAKESITITWSRQLSGVVDIAIFNAFGQIKSKGTFRIEESGPHGLELDLSHFEQGTYMLQLQNGQKTGVKKLIILP